MQKASAYHREMYAITQAVSKLRQDLLGHSFTILTDQQSLENLTEQVIQTPEQQHCLCKPVGYDFTILYRPGRQNLAADVLSRTPMASFLALSTRTFDFITTLQEANLSHAVLLDWQAALQQDLATVAEFSFRDGLLFHKNRLVIPYDSALGPRVPFIIIGWLCWGGKNIS